MILLKNCIEKQAIRARVALDAFPPFRTSFFELVEKTNDFAFKSTDFSKVMRVMHGHEVIDGRKKRSRGRAGGHCHARL